MTGIHALLPVLPAHERDHFLDELFAFMKRVYWPTHRSGDDGVAFKYAYFTLILSKA